MKNYVLLISILIYSPSIWAFDFKLTPMVGLGYRLDTSNSNYEQSQQNNEKRQDAFFFAGRVYTFEMESSESRVLFGGIGYVWQPPQEHDISFSPVAYKDPNGTIISLDLFAPSKERGGYLGFSIGWGF